MCNNITQRLKYKESVVKYSYKHGVTKAAIVYCECRKTIYRWRKRYDGSLESLKDKSRRPHYHPNQHTKEEQKLIRDYKRNNKDTGLVVLWVKLRKAGYKRTIQGLYYALQRLGIKHKLIKPYTPKENGRVERSHRKDQERFYYNRVFYSLEDLRNLGAEWRKEYNNFPMRPLGWLSPNEFLKRYKS